ncbi:MAG: hypothetical protein ACI9J3_002541 [Parvicellaceae bacterium]
MIKINSIFLVVLLIIISNGSYGQYNGIYIEGAFPDSGGVNVAFRNTVYSQGNVTYYQEDQSFSIDASGKWWMTVGEGVPTGISTSSTLDQLDFSLDSMGLAIEVDFGGGFIGLTDEEFRAVPYARHSRTSSENISLGARMQDIDTVGLSIDYAFSWNGMDWSVVLSNELIANYAIESNMSNSADTSLFAFQSHVQSIDTVLFSEVSDSSIFAINVNQSGYSDSSIYTDTAGYSILNNGLKLNGNNFTSFDIVGPTNNFPIRIRTNGIDRLHLGINGEFEIGSTDSLSSFYSDLGDGLKATGTRGSGSHLNLTNGNYVYYSPDKVAFLSGLVTDTLWDSSNVGIYSFVAGRNSWVRGTYSAAFGDSSFVTPIPNVSISPGKYSLAVGRNCGASGSNSFAVGYQSWAMKNRSVAMGYQCSTPYGYACMALGYRAVADGNIEPCVAIGNNVVANGKNSIILGNNVDGGSRRGTFMYGDNSTNDTLTNTTLNVHQFVVRANGGFIFYSDAGLLTGVQLSSGGGAWSTVSDSTKKQNKFLLNPFIVRDPLIKLRVSEWNYKTQDKSIVHVGPMAQDFYSAFKQGSRNDLITTTDIDGVILLGIKDLEGIFNSLENKMDPKYDKFDFKSVVGRLDKLERELDNR